MNHIDKSPTKELNCLHKLGGNSFIIEHNKLEKRPYDQMTDDLEVLNNVDYNVEEFEATKMEDRHSLKHKVMLALGSCALMVSTFAPFVSAVEQGTTANTETKTTQLSDYETYQLNYIQRPVNIEFSPLEGDNANKSEEDALLPSSQTAAELSQEIVVNTEVASIGKEIVADTEIASIEETPIPEAHNLEMSVDLLSSTAMAQNIIEKNVLFPSLSHPTVNRSIVERQLSAGSSIPKVNTSLPTAQQISRVNYQPAPSYNRQSSNTIIPVSERPVLMATAGISESDWNYVDYIITKESNWRPFVWNSQGSSAYGLCQSMESIWRKTWADDFMDNPVSQLEWCNWYALERYNSWQKAYEFWQKNNWW